MSLETQTTPTPVAQAESQRGRFAHKPALDGLRAVAVGSVMAFHFGASWAPGGFLGVDTFFVLSGYLITSLLLVEWHRLGTVRFSAFWARRARRLLPALFLVLVAVMVWAAFEAQTDRLESIRRDGLWTLFYGANWHFISSGQSYFDLFSEASPLRHAWSLAIEEQFYLVWPLVTFACLRLARGRRWLLATGSVLGIAGSAVFLARLYDPVDPSRAYYGTDTRASQLLVGALLAMLLLRWAPRGRGVQRALQSAGVAAAGFCVWAFARATDRDAWLYHGGFLAFAVATAVIIAAVVQDTRSPLRRVLCLGPVRWIGLISYGLYLWHWPVTVALTEARTGLSGISLAMARLGVTVGAATLSYYLIELPIRHGHRLRGRAAQVAAPLTGALTAVAIVVATSGATTAPEFLTARPNQVVHSESDAATAVPETATRMVLLGDSLAASLGDALQAEAAKHGVSLEARTRPGCGMTTAIPFANGAEVAWGKTCADGTAAYQTSAVEQTGAQVVLWLSSWETADYRVNGRLVRFGTRAGDEWLLNELEGARARVESAGAHLVLLTLPQPAERSETRVPSAEDLARPRHLNAVFREFAARHPDDVAVVDLAKIVCPSGAPCPEKVDGVVLRPRDGGHFEGDGPSWVAARLFPAIQAALARLPAAPGPAPTRAVSAPPVPALPPDVPVRSMVLLGDSVAATIEDALRTEASAHGVALALRTRPGCGLTTAAPVAGGVVVPWGPACGQGAPAFQASAVRETHAQVALWSSTWEEADQLVDGRILPFGSPEWEAWMLDQLEQARARVAPAWLLLLTNPPMAASSEVRTPTADELTRPVRLADVFYTFVRRHPTDTAVVNFAGIVCPLGPPCPPVVDGVTLRPRDGGHFSEEGAAWVAPRLYAAIQDALRYLQQRIDLSRTEYQ